MKELDPSDIIKILVTASELRLQELIAYLQSFLIENQANWIEQNFNFIYQLSSENDSFLEFQKYCTDLMSKERISCDGLESSEFHEFCDNQGHTASIAVSDGGSSSNGSSTKLSDCTTDSEGLGQNLSFSSLWFNEDLTTPARRSLFSIFYALKRQSSTSSILFKNGTQSLSLHPNVRHSKDITDTNEALKEQKKPSYYKTDMCRNFEERGSCRYGSKCQFAHSVSKLRNIQHHPKYKTGICITFWQNGTCPFGERCCFIHYNDRKSILEARRFMEKFWYN